MKLTLLLALITTLALPLSAADSRLDFKPADTIAAVLVRQEGQKVELRLHSGEKIGGKLEKVGDKLVHLSQIVGAELFAAGHLRPAVESGNARADGAPVAPLP